MRNLVLYLSSSKQAALKALAITMLLSLLIFTLALAASGDLDPTFSGDGKLTTGFLGDLFEGVHDIAIQSDGKIVAVGSAHGPFNAETESVFSIARYNPNGTLDATFSWDGRVVTDFGPMSDAFGVAIQGDGKIVLVGSNCAAGGTNCDLALARYKPDGSLDPAFSGDGRVSTDFGGGDNGSWGGITIQSNGKIVVSGYMHNGSDIDFALYRYNPNGSLDTTFHSDGMLNTGFGSGRDDYARKTVLQPDGKIVVAGSTCYGGGWQNCNFTLARYNSNGSLDTTFSVDGKQITDFGGSDYAHSVVRQADGKIVAVGQIENAGNCSLALARYKVNGALDTTFHADGKVTTTLPSTDCAWYYFLGAAIQSNGKIVVAASVGPDGSHDFLLARYNSNGSLDTTLSGDGKLVTDFGADDMADAIAIQSNGRIVLAGWSNLSGNYDFALARYMP